MGCGPAVIKFALARREAALAIFYNAPEPGYRCELCGCGPRLFGRRAVYRPKYFEA
ncbi:hypothetical protein DWUX_1797 [Desulfovibrio diazotrophicus]|nr:hypothetical protein DWUX_1797 [Desulfovibrio diazotrophicus]VVU42883.1 hypothetical protein DWUX_229 [Desulfovibrio diazotrophicus]